MGSAHDTFAAMLAPLREDDFLRSYWGRRFFYQPGEASRFTGLVSWVEISESLASRAHGSRDGRLILDGAEIPPVPLDEPVQVEAALQQGAMLNINAVDRWFPALRRLAADLAFVFRERTQVNLYASYAYGRGLRPHWDDHEMFVFQVAGKKYWRVYSPTEHAPLFHDPAESEQQQLGDPIWEGEVTAGGLLYLPRGYWHVAEGLASESIHLTAGIDCVTGLDLMDWLSRRLRESPAFRENLPRLGTAARQRDHAKKLAVEIKSLLDESLVGRFLAADDRDAPALAGFDGLTGASGATVLRWLAPRPVAIEVEEGLGRFLEFECIGREWHLPRWIEPVLRLLVERREVAREAVYVELESQLTRVGVDQALVLLLRHGLVAEFPAG